MRGHSASLHHLQSELIHVLFPTLNFYHLQSLYSTNCIVFHFPLRFIVVEGSLEVKLPTIWRDEKQSREVESDEKQSREVESEERKYICAKVSRKKIQAREMLGESRIAVFF